jgi:osmotically-inducible protein OsmY
MQNLHRIQVLLVLLMLPFFSGCALLVAAGVATVGTGVAVSQDRRTGGMLVEDQNIESKSNRRISEKMGDNAHVNVTSFNRNVLLTGEVSSESARKEIEQAVKSVEHVRNVVNEIAVTPVSSFTSRSNDALITSKVKGRFMDGGKFQINHVKVITEDSVVYLMGIVNADEAGSAVDIARSTNGVRKVVKVFEYMN